MQKVVPGISRVTIVTILLTTSENQWGGFYVMAILTSNGKVD